MNWYSYQKSYELVQSYQLTCDMKQVHDNRVQIHFTDVTADIPHKCINLFNCSNIYIHLSPQLKLFLNALKEKYNKETIIK